MLFNSFQFLIFFPLAVLVYFAIPHRWRWLFLLLASCYFYMAFVPAYILILAATIIIDYIAGIYIEGAQGKKRRLFLSMSIVANVGFLGFFKYFNFFAGNVNALAQLIHWNYSVSLLSIILPIGLSFHTFQAMSYTIEVYRGNQKAERNFGIYALYVMFFPQLVAGPIERPQHLLHQFYQKHNFNYEDAAAGIKYMLWGMFKKVVIADSVAVLIQPIFQSPHSFNGPTLVLAVFLFAFQLYADFSGYSDIAVGAARVLGIRLMMNFNRPYFSKSVAEFWRRWHISLMSWFRDYLYYPLVFSGKNRSRLRIYLALVATFLVSGLWHGADWKYVIMGGLNGIYLVSSQLTAKLRRRAVLLFRLQLVPKFHRFLQIMLTFCLICFGWIFFRAESASSAITFIGRLGNGWIALLSHPPLSLSALKQAFPLAAGDLGQTKFFVVLGACLGIAALLIVELTERRRPLLEFLGQQPVWVRWGIYYALILGILCFGKFGARQFIYFQF